MTRIAQVLGWFFIMIGGFNWCHVAFLMIAPGFDFPHIAARLSLGASMFVLGNELLDRVRHAELRKAIQFLYPRIEDAGPERWSR